MSGLSRCSVPMKAPVAYPKTRNSKDGALLSKPGVPGSGGRPTPDGAHSMSVGSSRGWMQLQPAADSWPGVMPSAFAVTAAAPAAPSAAINAISTVRLQILMWSLMPSPFVSELSGEVAFPAAIEAPAQTRAFGDHPGIG